MRLGPAGQFPSAEFKRGNGIGKAVPFQALDKGLCGPNSARATITEPIEVHVAFPVCTKRRIRRSALAAERRTP